MRHLYRHVGNVLGWTFSKALKGLRISLDLSHPVSSCQKTGGSNRELQGYKLLEFEDSII